MKTTTPAPDDSQLSSRISLDVPGTIGADLYLACLGHTSEILRKYDRLPDTDEGGE